MQLCYRNISYSCILSFGVLCNLKDTWEHYQFLYTNIYQWKVKFKPYIFVTKVTYSVNKSHIELHRTSFFQYITKLSLLVRKNVMTMNYKQTIKPPDILKRVKIIFDIFQISRIQKLIVTTSRVCCVHTIHEHLSNALHITTTLYVSFPQLNIV